MDYHPCLIKDLNHKIEGRGEFRNMEVHIYGILDKTLDKSEISTIFYQLKGTWYQ